MRHGNRVFLQWVVAASLLMSGGTVGPRVEAAAVAASPAGTAAGQAAPQLPRDLFRGPARQRAMREIERLRAIKSRHLERIRAIPDIRGFGIGFDVERKTFVFDVDIDVDAAEPSSVPSDLEGVPVRVRRSGAGRTLNGGGTEANPSHPDTLPLPVEMGNSAHTYVCATSCTLGFKACDISTNQNVYVTAGHCSVNQFAIYPYYCAGSALPGELTQHPAPDDTPGHCDPGATVGSVSQSIVPACGSYNTVDASSVISENTQTQYSIRDIGAPSPYQDAAMPSDLVQKSGRTTGWTRGIVLDVFYDLWMQDPLHLVNCSGNCLDYWISDQLLITNVFALTDFVAGGDSGAAVLDVPEGNDPPHVVGLLTHFADDAFGNARGVANHGSTVIGGLGLSLNPLDCVQSCAVTTAAQSTSTGSPLITIRVFLDLRDFVLSRSKRGRGYIDLYYRFTSDLVGLMVEHPALLARTTQLLDEIAPLARDVTAGRDVVVPSALIDAADALLARYGDLSDNGELERAMARVRRDLHTPSVLREFGIRAAP